MNSQTNGGFTDATSNDVQVFQYGTVTADNRLWKLEATSEGYYRLKGGCDCAINFHPDSVNGVDMHVLAGIDFSSWVGQGADLRFGIPGIGSSNIEFWRKAWSPNEGAYNILPRKARTVDKVSLRI